MKSTIDPFYENTDWTYQASFLENQLNQFATTTSPFAMPQKSAQYVQVENLLFATYRSWAEYEYQKGNKSKAREIISRGLQHDPNNEYLQQFLVDKRARADKEQLKRTSIFLAIASAIHGVYVFNSMEQGKEALSKRHYIMGLFTIPGGAALMAFAIVLPMLDPIIDLEINYPQIAARLKVFIAIGGVYFQYSPGLNVLLSFSYKI